jgi:nanoRNase/pAp phosphatase (c-di-AMP/oligoRNAs hydrolase)
MEHALLDVPDSRSFTLRRVGQRLLGARRVVLTTHVNADGDGCGSEAAAAAWLEERGVEATIVNPTEFPQTFRFLLHRQDVVAELGTPEAAAALEAAFLGMRQSAEGQVMLREVFNLDGFEPAPKMGYRALYRVALSTL